MSSMQTNSLLPAGIKRSHLAIGAVIVFIVMALCCGGWLTNTYANNQTQGKVKEAGLVAVYGDAANYLSDCVTRTFQVASTAHANTEAAAQLIREAVAGAGEGGKFNLDTTQGQQGFFPMLVQAWPDLKQQQELYAEVIRTINGCRMEFRGKQSVVLDQVREFNAWRGDFWGSKLGRGSFPDSDLYINLPNVPKASGMAALKQMGQPIITADTADAYKNGTYTPPNPFPTQPQPTPSGR